MPDRRRADEIAGLIHEALNAFQVSQTRVQMAQEQLKRAYAASDKGAKLLHDAMTIATRVSAPHGERVELNAVMQEIADHLAGVFAGVAIVVTLNPEPLWTDVDRELLFRALDNLIRNAADAMPSGGTVSLTTVFQEYDSGQMVCIQVADTGCGMDDATLAKLWQPGFTTKDTTTRPRGLGLSQVKRFVEEAGGRPRVESRPGEGSRFELCFPRVLEAA